ncbi:flagellar assembly protein T N-terminal domain-containing protein [Aliiglaciecola lipolytica]|uniref:flagellar assembly protein T N-terminal domain-containing protein n=1 Tax=Aliiglaciecola lipolytica TaxID=477689 RepID=UPI001C08CF15|nr:flagellar assembly protein T N-terminal domain-containing protein [Aliiglaciecola lipolytica]MBU2877958.1 flagella assembly protein FlgT [Aliiglaciecola lipolytica]
MKPINCQIFSVKLITLFCAFCAALFSAQSLAAWFESSGQAAIRNGNIELARQNATQEAIKQVLLFAGASVHSVQKMANGVLQNDDLTIRASGEVNSIELIDEVFRDGYLTVSLRADIFPQKNTCQSSEYPKSIVTTWHPIDNREQATTGNLFEIGTRLPEVLQQNFEDFAQQSSIQTILPFYYAQQPLSMINDAMALAKQSSSQYVLTATVKDLSLNNVNQSKWQFWNNPTPIRNFSYQVALYDGYTGTLMWQKLYSSNAPWDFDTHQSVDINSGLLWQSAYGVAISSIMQDIAINVDEKLACSPTYGRIIQVRGDQLTLNIGSNQGIQNGDEFTLFQLQQKHNPQGQTFTQFNLHPTPVRVVSVSPGTAVAVSKDGTLLANIQANDFVSRQ